MDDLRDPAQAEALEHYAPDAYLRRREFLQRVAMGAGLAAGMGTVLHPDVLLAQAARTRAVPLPSARNLPIDTFVVLMMENRSFDHYLGWLPGADGRQEGLLYADAEGQAQATRPMAPDWQGCDHPDPDHSWEGGREQMNGGRMDGFLRSGANDTFAISYYREEDLGFIPAAARAFTSYDRYFCSILASTYPNREYMHAAQSYGLVDNRIPPQAGYNSGFPDNTIFAALAAKGVEARYYYSDVPVSALWGAAGLSRSARVDEYYARASAGTLPPVSFVDPAFANEGGGTSGDEHPHGDVRVGQAFMADIVHAFMESPQWKRGALFIIYDEWGGFFDHVRPPRVPDSRASRDPAQDFGQLGIRIPAVAISPWVRRRYVDHGIYGHESILKLIEYRYGLRPLTVRDAYAHNIGHSFDFESRPRLDPPSLPTPPAVVGMQCANQPPGLLLTYDKRPEPHDMTELVTSGYLEHLGFKYRPADPATIFRHPHKVKSAHRTGWHHVSSKRRHAR